MEGKLSMQPVFNLRLRALRRPVESCFLVVLAVLLLVALVSAPGCSREVQSKCHITGRATFNGQPAENVCIRFHVANNTKQALKPFGAFTNPDGTFDLRVENPGEYLITAVWPEVTVVEGEEVEGADRLRNAWSNVLAPRVKQVINEGENAVPPIELAVFETSPPSQLDPNVNVENY
jgi:hypothetical protein